MNIRRHSISIGLLSVSLLWAAFAGAQEKFPTGKFGAQGFVINFGADGRHAVMQDGNVVVEGTYKVTGDQIEMTDLKGQYACAESGAGTFKWKYEGEALSFTKVTDSCEGRAGALTSGKWTKQAETK
jgi:hypothetical protein